MDQSGGNSGRVFDLPIMAPADEIAGVVRLGHHGGTRVAALLHRLAPFAQPMLQNGGGGWRGGGLGVAFMIPPRPHPHGICQTAGLLSHGVRLDGAGGRFIRNHENPRISA